MGEGNSERPSPSTVIAISASKRRPLRGKFFSKLERSTFFSPSALTCVASLCALPPSLTRRERNTPWRLTVGPTCQLHIALVRLGYFSLLKSLRLESSARLPPQRALASLRPPQRRRAEEEEMARLTVEQAKREAGSAGTLATSLNLSHRALSDVGAV